MKVVVVYCFPLVNHRVYFALAKRFSDTLRQCPAGTDYELHVGCNGGQPSVFEEQLFAGLSAHFHSRDNTGWDIGLYQWAADRLDSDLMVCLGANCHFHRPGWLARMVESYVDHGPNLYGCRGYFYPAGHGHHIRTTSFWLHPALLRSYPYLVGNSRAMRYAFEHGHNNLTQWVENSGLEALVVTWDGVFGVNDWKDGFGEIDTCLVLDQWTHRPGSVLDRNP